MIGILGFLILKIVFGLTFSTLNIVFFFLATYLIDLDPLISLFTTCKKIPEAKFIIEAIKGKDFYQTATLATIYHKKFNKLLIHNIFGLILVIIGFVITVFLKTNLLIAIFGGILIHFIIDISDDVIQVGHIRNWLWPCFKSV